MKEMILRLSTLLLALIMALALICGCNKTDGTVDDGGNVENPGNTDKPGDNDDSEDGGNTDDSTDTESVQITTTIYEIAKHGNLILYMYGSELFDKGFEHGDVVEIAIGEKKWDVPLCTSYSDVDNGEAVLRATGAEDGVVLALNMGDFATTAGIAKKTVIEEEPGYRWDYLIESPVQITITLKEEDGYREEWLIRQLVRTNERDDYPHLTDEEFANFRVIGTTGMGKGLLYRSSSPIKPDLGRNTYADKAAKDAGILTIVNLADASNTYEGTENTYYSTCKVAYVNLETDFLSEATLGGIADGMRFIIDNNGPYLIHCNEGKDRGGFISALLECLMGATMDEVIDDYMVTYYNYYGVEKGSEKYNAVLNNNLIKVLNITFDVEDIYKADLVTEAEEYLMEDVGLTADEVAALKARLVISLQDIYDASKTEALLKNHESVHIRNELVGEFWGETYLTNDYSFKYFPNQELTFAELMTDDVRYYYNAGDRLLYLFVTPDGVSDFASERAEAYGAVVLGAETLDDIIESVEIKDGRITVISVLGGKNLDIWAEFGVTAGRFEYVLDAETREIISINSEYTYADGSVSRDVIELTYDAEEPETLKVFSEYVNRTEDLRDVTVVTNPGTDQEEIMSIQAPKGMIIGFEYGEESGYTVKFYTDASCTESYDPYEGTDSDLTVYIKWEIDPREETYIEAYKLLEERDYEAAYELFVSLGDYKDAAKEAAYFRYMPTGHNVEYLYDGEEGTITYTVTLNEQNLPATVVEEYSDGYKYTSNYVYNEFGLVVRQESYDTDGMKELCEATFDENGNYVNVTITDEDGNVSKFDYIYNNKGQQIKVVTTNMPDHYLSYTVEYDEKGRESKVVYVYEDGNEIEETVYNEAGKILKKTWSKEGDDAYLVYDYSYDEKGRLVEIIFAKAGEPDGFRKVTYNDKDQMLTEHLLYNDGYEYTNIFEYDEHGNAIKMTYSDNEGDEDVTESSYKLVYLPYEYTEDDWMKIFYSTRCWD